MKAKISNGHAKSQRCFAICKQNISTFIYEARHGLTYIIFSIKLTFDNNGLVIMVVPIFTHVLFKQTQLIRETS